LLTLFVVFVLIGVLRRIWGSGARRPLEAEA
jgi:hypothetical protein